MNNVVSECFQKKNLITIAIITITIEKCSTYFDRLLSPTIRFEGPILTDDLGCGRWSEFRFKFKNVRKKTELIILRLSAPRFLKNKKENCQKISYKMLLNLP
jgi:hypothetical protein